jgi:AraC-like DNA-binding protein
MVSSKYKNGSGVPLMVSSNFVDSYFDAWNQHDAGGVAEHLAQNGTYWDMPIKQHVSRDGLIAHLEEFFARDTNVYELVGAVLTSDNAIAFQYRSGPASGASPDETWTGAEFITMAGKAAGKIEDYYEHPGKGAVVQRYAKSGLSTAELQAVTQRLTTLMNTEQLYLNSDLTLPQLAARLECSVNHLSQAINAGFGIGFFDFINQYRIQEATGMLCKKKAQADAILNIALSVGFNSTSTFYAAFKKTTGQTPAQYRRTQLLNTAS